MKFTVPNALRQGFAFSLFAGGYRLVNLYHGDVERAVEEMCAADERMTGVPTRIVRHNTHHDSFTFSAGLLG